jgi:hypothetical protein
VQQCAVGCASLGAESAANAGSSWDVGSAGSRWWIVHYEAGARNPISVRTTLTRPSRNVSMSMPRTAGLPGGP